MPFARLCSPPPASLGAFLLWTALKIYRDYRKHDEHSRRLTDLLRYVRRHLKAHKGLPRHKLTVMENGKRLITPMLIVIIALGSTDLLFALDSIPAIYGLTQEPYLVSHRECLRVDGATAALLLNQLVAQKACLPLCWLVDHPGIHQHQVG